MSDGEFMYVHQPSQMNRPMDGDRLIGEPETTGEPKRVSRSSMIIAVTITVVVVGGIFAWIFH